MRRAPWHVKGIHPDAREVARDAARRSGLSVGEWLNSVIIDATANDPAASTAYYGYQDRGGPHLYGPAPYRSDDRFASISRQIDELKRRVNRLSQTPSTRTAPYVDHTAGAGNRRRADGFVRGGHDHASAPSQRNFGVDEALAEITARQQALDGEVTESAGHSDAAEPPAPPLQPDDAIAEQQLSEIAARMKALQGTCRFDGMTAELARTIEEAAPRRAIEGIEEQLRRLSSQIEALRAPPALDQNLDFLRRELSELGRKINEASPQRAVAPIAEQIEGLAAQVAKLHPPPRVDEIAAELRQDLAKFAAPSQGSTSSHATSSIEEQIRALTAEVAGLHRPHWLDEIADTLRRDLAEIGTALKNAIPQHVVESIDEQVHSLTAQIAQLPQPAEVNEIAGALRHDLAEIAEVLQNAVPTQALASLEQEVRELGARIESERSSRYGVAAAPGDLEHDFAEIRDRLRAMTPAEDLAKLNEAIQTLSSKADAFASERSAGEILHQLDEAIAALNGIVSHIASQDAVADLSRDIRALADKFDQESRKTTDADVMSTLDRRLAEMADALGRSRAAEAPAIPADFDLIIKKLTDRLEAIQVPAADQAGLKNIEERIVTLSEKLDVSEVRLGRLDGMERGVDDLVTQIKELRVQNEKKLQAIQQQLIDSATQALSAPAEAIRRDVATLKEIQASVDRRTQDTFEAVYGTIEQVVDRLAVIEQGLREQDDRADKTAAEGPGAVMPPEGYITAAPAFPNMPFLRDRAAVAAEPPMASPRPEPAMTPAGGTSPSRSSSSAASVRPPIDSELPPDAPLEPGSGARRVRIVNSAIDRIAASEAVNGTAKPAETTPTTRANFVAVARRAAQSVANEQATQASPRPEKPDTGAKDRRSKLISKLGPRIKSVVLGISVVMLVLGALRLAFDLFGSSQPPTANPPVSRMEDATAPPSGSGQTVPPVESSPPGKGAAIDPVAPGPRTAALIPTDTSLGQGPASGVIGEYGSSVAVPNAATTAMAPAAPDATGSVMPQTAAAQPAAPRDLAADPLPPTIGSKALVAAATAGDPGASFEIATRFAEGRNVPQDFALAAAWFDRAARHGLAPAQFRLGSMYEKGLGLKKDLQEARRLYLAAADKNNGKAMHNLAVLYAEGIDGKPDYTIASQWFRKAAALGVVDSQYNLAILYARGVGVERNMVESYKWFALAADGGDKDAVKKRDEIATRLDPQQLESARQAVEAFVPDRQPDEAVTVKAPAGGWDQIAVAAPAKPKAAH